MNAKQIERALNIVLRLTKVADAKVKHTSANSVVFECPKTDTAKILRVAHKAMGSTEHLALPITEVVAGIEGRVMWDRTTGNRHNWFQRSLTIQQHGKRTVLTLSHLVPQVQRELI